MTDIINQKHRQNSIIIQPDLGWLGPKPANTRDEKITQIKTEFIDSRALLIEGATASDFSEYPYISANMSTQKLIACVDMLNKNKGYVVIQGLDKISQEEQEKFIPLLKDKQILSSKLSDTTQLLVPIEDLTAISPKIKHLTFCLKV